MTFENLYPEIKVSTSPTHVFFLNGPFSQWWFSEFSAIIPTPDGGKDLVLDFHCCEQYMMACKSALMGDFMTLERIMEVEQTDDWRDAPRRIKELGREIAPWNQKLWDDNCDEIVFNGNLAKFNQNRELRDFLLSFQGKTFVEGAYYDKIWGVGLAWNNPKIVDPNNWQGMNKLGDALTKVRKIISEGIIRETIRNI